MSDSTPNGDHDQSKLTPRHPPGRCTRKARAYAVEIRRLHALGYTLEAIREALADVGVNVSKSTVHRETARQVAKPSMATARDGVQLF